MIHPILERPIVRFPLYGLFTLFTLLVCLILTFPDERIKQIVIVQAEQALNEGKSSQAGDTIWEVSIEDLDLWWLSGVELHHVKLKEKWTDEQIEQAAQEAEQGAPPMKPLSVHIPRVAARVSVFKSIANVGLGALFLIDFEEGGAITGDLVQTSEYVSIKASFDEVDVFKAAIVESVTGVPGFGELNGDVAVTIDPKTGMANDGRIDLEGTKLTIGPAIVKTEMLPSMAYLEVPQTSLGNLFIKASITGKPGKPTTVTFERVENEKARDVLLQMWGKLSLYPQSDRSSADIQTRLQFNEKYVNANSLKPLLNLQLFRVGKSNDNWYGITLKGRLSKLKPAGSVLAARGPRGANKKAPTPKPPAARPAEEEEEEEE